MILYVILLRMKHGVLQVAMRVGNFMSCVVPGWFQSAITALFI